MPDDLDITTPEDRAVFIFLLIAVYRVLNFQEESLTHFKTSVIAPTRKGPKKIRTFNPVLS